jgi:acyl transferase domain-containing protein/SAM-dependent methyltransferase
MTEALTPVKRALIEIRELKARLAASEAAQRAAGSAQRAAEAAQREPIAVIGLGLRFPGGVRDAKGFAELLWSGTDAVGAIPPERWSLDELYAEDPDAPGKLTTRHGAFLDDIDRFDAEFFGIAPREAAIMDPQQRLLLEVGWEALEDAGHAAGLRGSNAGVYVGICNNDYGRALFARRELIDAYVSTGNAASVAAGRLSYVLGIHGPSMAIDTACSSSLVAVHLACQGLRAGECDLALAGGINLILTPEMNISFSKARMMAPDGRCKTFDAAADGYVRGEGVAFLVLRRLSDAVKDHDRILAVLRGSAINQDGRSGGLTAPNGPAQEAVIRAALDAAGVAAADIGYVEAHGTGTSLGDPIEVGALAAVLCGEGRAQPLAIGAVKTNIGHLEAAAGVAGVIKAILALQRREIPPNLHFHQGNPHIDWSAPITVPTAATPFAPIGGRRLVGVSSFGFSGTNAHVILEEAPPLPAATAAAEPERPLHLLALSARDETTLAALARRYQTALTSDTPVADACFTANAGRAHFACRLAVTGATSDELARGLAAHLAGEAHPAVAAGRAEGARPQIAFLFTGQGAQYAGMGRRLYETAPAFRRVLDDCAARLAPHLPRGLTDVLFAPDISTPINTTAWAQPATFALEVALAALWRSFGIEPAVVLGHSLGEYAAACVAGLLPLDDALRLVAARGRLTQELAAEGAMAAIFAPQEVVEAEVARSAGALTIAAYNGPAHHVISGAPALVEAAVTRFEAAGIEVKRLRVPHGAHSPLIEPVLPAFRNVLAGIRFATPRMALVSNVTGALADAEEIGRPDYWVAHMRQPVRFAQSMQALAAQGITHCIEIGPHPVLLGIGAESLPGSTVEWLPSLRRNRPDWCDLLESLQRLYVGGAGIDWAGFDQNYPRRRVALPATPFRRSRHWIDAVGEAPAPSVAPWPAVTAALDRQALQAPLDLNAASYPTKWDLLARLTTAHAARTLREAGLFAAAGERHTLAGILEGAGIAASYRHLVSRWLDRLVEAGLLHSEGEAYVAAAPLPDPGLPALWEEAETLFSDNRPLLAYVRHCSALVGAVLTGRESPLETLFPGGQFELAENLYERSTTMRYVNALAGSALEALARALPAGRSLRILEVGAGTGGTSAALLPLLPAERSKYLFTDVSDPFLDRARTRFAAYSFVDFARLDIDRDPAEQGVAAAGFDVIVSANAIHASTDLRAALGRLHDLLAPGGTLILIESTTHLAWFDMTTGLIEGWQHFADDLRHEHPLLPPAGWVAALGDAGFAEAGAWPRPGTSADHLGQHVLVARRPGSAAIGAVAEAPAVAAEVSGAPIEIPLAAADSLRLRLAEAMPADRIEVMRDFVRARVMAVLRLDPADPPGRNARLMDLGFDSLMAVQLRNQLGTGLALEKPLPATLMFDHPTINALAAHLTERLFPADPGDLAVPAPPSEPLALGAAVVAAMSDAEVEALLLERLTQS